MIRGEKEGDVAGLGGVGAGADACQVAADEYLCDR